MVAPNKAEIEALIAEDETRAAEVEEELKEEE